MENDDFLRQLNRIDLNLLTVLHAILETGSTKGAAERLGRTQSAASHALGRLRDLFGDPLFLRRGPRLTPTPLALQLQQPLRRILADAASIVSSGRTFDPATTQQRLSLAAANVCLSMLLKLVASLSAQAPGLHFDLSSARHGTSRLANGEVDLLLSLYRTDFPAHLEVTALPNVEWAVFARKELDISDTPTAYDWASRGHIQVDTGPGGRDPIKDAARLAGVERTVRVRVAGFQEALHVAASTDYLFTSFGALVGEQAAALGLRRLPMPFPVPPAPMTLVTRAGQHDPLSRWLHDRARALLSAA